MNILNNFISKVFSILHWFLHLSIFKKVLVVILIILVSWFISAQINKQNNKPQYQTAQVERGTLIDSVTASGTVSSGSNASVSTQASGIISAVYVKNGDSVLQGQKIADITLDQTSAQKQAAAYASYLSAQNTLNSAKAKINSLQSALFVANQAFINDKGISNPTDQQKTDPKYVEENADWLQAEADYKNQQGVIAAAQASFSSAWYTYNQTSATITAPISGIVSNLNISAGAPIVNSSSSTSSSTSTTTTSSQTIGNITMEGAKLAATVSLTEIDVTKIKIGQKVTMTMDAFPDKTFTGKVSAIDSNGSVSSGVTSYPTTITFDTAPDNIYPNMAVSATIITAVKNDVLMVPSSAVQTQNGQSTVRVFTNGQVQNIPVETGLVSNTQTEIISGLTEGQTIVTGTIVTQTTGGTQVASPFGGAGFGGGARGFGGGGGGSIRRVGN